MRCTGLRKDGSACGMVVVPGTERCRWHPAPIVPKSRFDGWSKNEIVTYIKNVTHGRVVLSEGNSWEGLVSQAEEFD